MSQPVRSDSNAAASTGPAAAVCTHHTTPKQGTNTQPPPPSHACQRAIRSPTYLPALPDVGAARLAVLVHELHAHRLVPVQHHLGDKTLRGDVQVRALPHTPGQVARRGRHTPAPLLRHLEAAEPDLGAGPVVEVRVGRPAHLRAGVEEALRQRVLVPHLVHGVVAPDAVVGVGAAGHVVLCVRVSVCMCRVGPAGSGKVRSTCVRSPTKQPPKKQNNNQQAQYTIQCAPRPS